ncbi:hypothetical protein PHLCEN_2v5976 [Hermanssonia centrifuga]|uniref:Uncharacterized protein n=1 Tax=Hermanssonia centrifuga TaxID=98765 RepID=A0A2R6P0T8_9APHY|nr:hypothetical protein PHLCEN_2v5976 [Hermanssonia centrifuga]
MALEDAVVFSTLFSHLKSWDQVGSFVSAYQEIRETRTKAVNTVDVSNAELVRMPPGPNRDRRNESMRRARREWDDDALRREFEGVAALFAYEAQDAAEEWWVNWGWFKKSETDRETVNFGFITPFSSFFTPFEPTKSWNPDIAESYLPHWRD